MPDGCSRSLDSSNHSSPFTKNDCLDRRDAQSTSKLGPEADI